MQDNNNYIVVTFPSQKAEMLFRASDGMCIGQQKNETVIYGDQPNKKSSHVFIDQASASAWLRGPCAEKDLIALALPAGVSLEVREGEGSVILPPGGIDFPDMASGGIIGKSRTN